MKTHCSRKAQRNQIQHSKWRVHTNSNKTLGRNTTKQKQHKYVQTIVADLEKQKATKTHTTKQQNNKHVQTTLADLEKIKTTKTHKTKNNQTTNSFKLLWLIWKSKTKHKTQTNIVKLFWLRPNFSQSSLNMFFVVFVFVCFSRSAKVVWTFVFFCVFVVPECFLLFGMDPSFEVLARTPLSPGLGLNGGLPSCRFNETAG